ncbi:putative transcription factor bHLH041 isoform X1 [Cucumis melo var. makuwa]|uniref:Transcription factor bHLH041 isoform X1 n=1 Tax=Cucumis melo var. makuwa TaxID=1194695 RepID=A0A5A7UIT1_CUCMM|nr:putative transcription factor bHLH041 isoform X1 [Cucumis melo var. makuwa]TYK10064.1 putative transcription factor bHLH041 isoform X1 [Cucumis melo var. makuwa]
MQSFGCTYICLWSYFPQPSNCLRFSDGLFLKEFDQEQVGSLSLLLFREYQQLEFSVDDGLIPGLAYKHNDPCLKLENSQLQTYASADVQRQFYLTSIFLGSIHGEIELGFSSVSQVDIEMIISSLVPVDVVAPKVPIMELPQPSTKSKLIPGPSSIPILNPNTLSSSSSSLRSSSMDSPAESPFTTADIPILQSQLQPSSINSIFAQARNLQFPTPEALDEAMTRTILAVLSSPACSSSSSVHQPLENLPPSYHVNVKSSAFKKYARVLTPTKIRLNRNLSTRQSLLKRSLAFMTNLNLMRLRERMPTTSRPTSSQLHHVISERRRREKLNDSFQALKSLLPPGTKKDKGSVLTTTREYMSSLKAQVAELSRRNQQLEAQLLQSSKEEEKEEAILFPREDIRFRVGISQVQESTSEGQIIDLNIATRGESSSLTNIVIGVLEFLRQLNNVRVLSMDGNTQLTPSSSSINHLTLRLIIESFDNHFEGIWSIELSS